MAWEPDYTTTAALADYLRIDDSDDDVELALAITAASRAVDRATARQFGLVASPEERYYTPEFDCYHQVWRCEVDDVMIVTGFEVDSDNAGDDTYATALTTYTLRPRNAPVKNRPYTELRFSASGTSPVATVDSLRVTARWGWSAVPETVEQATLLQASRVFARRNAPFGIAGSPESGSEMRLLAKVDADVQLMLNAYVRWWGAR